MAIKSILAAALIAAVTSTSVQAASKCTMKDYREASQLISQINAADYRFRNAKIKNFCSAGRQYMSVIKRADYWIQAHKYCGNLSARDRAELRTLHRDVQSAARDLNRVCR
ncbi:hypothetical protein [Aestuariivirga sp.]|uniref:hypothetical protein n=1 Tax=Aestuariivirga sp. TaxID=2650926 RepID=UPI0039E61722